MFKVVKGWSGPMMKIPLVAELSVRLIYLWSSLLRHQYHDASIRFPPRLRQKRWTATAQDILDHEVNIAGDIFLSSAFVSYLGVFTGPFRNSLVKSWAVILRDRGIRVSEGYSLAQVSKMPSVDEKILTYKWRGHFLRISWPTHGGGHFSRISSLWVLPEIWGVKSVMSWNASVTIVL